MLFVDGYAFMLFRYMLVFAIALVVFLRDTFTYLGLVGHLEFAKKTEQKASNTFLRRVPHFQFLLLFSNLL